MPSIDPDTALQLARQVATIYGDAQSSMLKKVSQRLANGVDQPGWAEAKQAQIRRIRHEALVDIRRLEKLGPDAVQSVIEESYGIGIEAAKSEREVSISSSFIGSNRAAVEALAKETIGAVTSTHTQILRSSVDMYRRTIAETMAQTLTGTQTRREVAQAAMDKFASRGITGFVDKAGRNWQLESYTEMATRTGSGHAMIEGRLQTYQAAGRDLVIVSDAPEECPVCVVSGTVIEGPIAEWRCRSEYSGDLISISTATGKKLSGTPNHTVLTLSGWRRLKDLNPGDKIVSYSGQKSLARVVPNYIQMPTVVEKVGELSVPLLLASPSRRELDSNVSYREIQAIPPGGCLDSEIKTALLEPLSDLSLVTRAQDGARFAGFGGTLKSLLRSRLSSGRSVSGSEHFLPVDSGSVSPAFTHGSTGPGGALLVAEAGRVTDNTMMASSGFDSSPAQVVGDYPTADAENGGQLLHCLAGLVEMDEIISLSVSQFSGHVWDLQTAPSWYVSNGIISHNCRPWEGKTLSISGKGKYPSVASARAAGLLHSNCRHDLRVFIPGLTKRFTNTSDPEGDKLRQKQRYMERQVREKKRQVLSAEQFGNSPLLAKRQTQLAGAQKKLTGFIDEHDRKRLRYREQISRAI